MDLKKKYFYDGSRPFKISKCSTDETSLCDDRKEAESKMAENNKLIDELQSKLYAEKREGVIFLFQAMDAAGKDGTIRAVLTCLSPHGVHEASFKSPSATDLSHDFLWRVHAMVPAKGEIAIFNRSHYEDVLIGKVKELYRTQSNARRIDLDKVIENRYKDIKNFEEYLYRNNIRIVKIFLNVSKDEQARRFLARIEEPEKNWKFSESDYEERAYWDEYQEAFESAINATATKHCPWFVVPADHKWYMRYIVSGIILETLRDMDPQYPEVTEERLATFSKYKEELLDELPDDDPAKAGKKKKKKKKNKDKKKKNSETTEEFLIEELLTDEFLSGEEQIKELLTEEFLSGEEQIEETLNDEFEIGEEQIEEILNEKLEAGEKQIEETLNEELKAGEEQIEKTLNEELKAGEEQIEETLNEELKAGKEQVEETLNEELEAGEKQIEETLNEELKAGEEQVEETLNEELKAGEEQEEEASAEESQAEEAPTEESQAEEAPTEESQAEEAQAEETPAEETQAEKVPTEEAPTEEAPAEKPQAEEAPAEKNPAEKPQPRRSRSKRHRSYNA